jgi:DNA repair exonuclease SbcCD ATPase subunit
VALSEKVTSLEKSLEQVAELEGTVSDLSNQLTAAQDTIAKQSAAAAAEAEAREESMATSAARVSELEAALAALESQAREGATRADELQGQLDVALKSSEESAARVTTLETELASAYEDQEAEAQVPPCRATSWPSPAAITRRHRPPPSPWTLPSVCSHLSAHMPCSLPIIGLRGCKPRDRVRFRG